jgi:hypothetical protein
VAQVVDLTQSIRQSNIILLKQEALVEVVVASKQPREMVILDKMPLELVRLWFCQVVLAYRAILRQVLAVLAVAVVLKELHHHLQLAVAVVHQMAVVVEMLCKILI